MSDVSEHETIATLQLESNALLLDRAFKKGF